MHTPAPWLLSDARSTKVELINSAKGHAIGEIVWVDVRNPDDAKLISAAPELLEACLEALELFNKVPELIDYIDTFHNLRTVINKAT
jgi:hypothetical protein